MSNNKNQLKKYFVLSLLLGFMLILTACSYTANVADSPPESLSDEDSVDYGDQSNWAYLELGDNYKKADVFFICPTVYGGDEDNYFMSLSDEDTKSNFVGAVNMEKGIYDENARFFAPYYRQVGLNVYTLSMEEQEKYLIEAYKDVKASFDYYFKNYNQNRPIILAGFSQGADMCIRLIKDYFTEDMVKNQLVACYAIGWRVTDDELNENPQLKFAQGESDTGVVIAFNSESEDTDSSLMIPEGIKTHCINPLNWKTDNTPADKSLNAGACFTDYSGSIVNEINNLTGAYIDESRGALKVTDVSVEDYPAGIYIFDDGIYHLYDYQFFYRNLQENVNKRLDAFEKPAAEDPAVKSSTADITIEDIMKANSQDALWSSCSSLLRKTDTGIVCYNSPDFFYFYDGYTEEVRTPEIHYCETRDDKFATLYINQLFYSDKYQSGFDPDSTGVENIESVEEKDGLIYVTTILPEEYWEDFYDDTEGIEKKGSCYAVSPDSLLLKKLEGYVVEDGRTETAHQEYIYDAEVPREAAAFYEKVKNEDDLRTCTMVINPGTDEEQSYSVKTLKGAKVYMWPGEGDYQVFDDRECTIPHVVSEDLDSDAALYFSNK